MERKGMSCSEAGKIGAEKAKQFYADKKLSDMQAYYENPEICPQCGKPIPYEKRFNKFCSVSCGTIYKNMHRDKSIYEKQAKTLHDYYASKPKNKPVCKCCGCKKGECVDSYVCERYKMLNGLEIFGFDTNTIGTINVIEEFYRIRNILQDFYNENGANDKMLYDKFGYTSGGANFHKILKRLDIVTRGQSGAVRFAIEHNRRDGILQGEGYKFKTEHHKAWFGKTFYLRSSYESNYANILDEQKILYAVEDLKIKYYDTQKSQYRIAIPDFYLEETNTIVEIKSTYTLDIQNMKDKVKAYTELGYEFKLILEGVETKL